jgi:hypothetical protein
VWNLEACFPKEITEPTRGLYKPIAATAPVEPQPGEPATIAIQPPVVSQPPIRESDFYSPFAQYLKNDLDEVTDVAPFGGAGLKTKWGTPDVIGVYKSLASNLVKIPLEIVSAEIKIDPQQPMVAFGQAVAYRLFSAKTYIVMPTSLTEEDQGQLEALCMLFGVGLSLFDLDLKNPGFPIRVRAHLHRHHRHPRRPGSAT